MEVCWKIWVFEWIWAGTMVTNTVGGGGKFVPVAALPVSPVSSREAHSSVVLYSPGALLKIKAEDVMIYGEYFTQWGETVKWS